MEETYPNYSVYLQIGGQLKLPFGKKRVKIYESFEAHKAARNYWTKLKEKVDVVLLKYEAPYDCTIIKVFPRKDKETEGLLERGG